MRGVDHQNKINVKCGVVQIKDMSRHNNINHKLILSPVQTPINIWNYLAMTKKRRKKRKTIKFQKTNSH